MSGGSRLPLGDASGSVMSLLRERNTCILCGDVLSSFHRPQEVSGAQPCDLSSLHFSCVFVDMSSSSTSEGTKRRRARAAELPTEGIELAVVGEVAPEGAGPVDGAPEGASSSGQPVTESQPVAESQLQPSGPAVAVPEVPPPPPRMLEGPPMQVGDGLETAGIVIEEASASKATDRVAVVLTPAPVPIKAMPAVPAAPAPPVKAMPRPPDHPPPAKASGAQPSVLRSLRLRGRFAIYRRLLRFHRLLPKGSVGRACHRRGGSEAVSEEVRRQKEGPRQGADRPPTRRPPATATDRRIAREILMRKSSSSQHPRRTLLDKLRLGKARRAARREDHPRLPARKRKAGKIFDPASGSYQEVDLNVPARPPIERSYSGFSMAKSLGGRCRGCGKRGHLLAWCPMVQRRVLLSTSKVALFPRQELPKVERPEFARGYVDSVVPDDSISRVAAYEEEPGIGTLVSSSQSGTSAENIAKTPPAPPVPKHRRVRHFDPAVPHPKTPPASSASIPKTPPKKPAKKAQPVSSPGGSPAAPKPVASVPPAPKPPVS